MSTTSPITREDWVLDILSSQLKLPFKQFEEVKKHGGGNGSAGRIFSEFGKDFDNDADISDGIFRTALWEKNSQQIALVKFDMGSEEEPATTVGVEDGGKERERILEEVELLKQIKKHDNIIELFGVTQDPETKAYLMVSQHAEYNLHDYLSKNYREMSWVAKLRIAGETAEALHYLHQFGISHGDLHSRNVLIDSKGHALITNPISSIFTDNVYTLKNLQSSIPFIDPQVLENSRRKVDRRSDIYSYGVVLWEISSGREPFNSIPYDFSLAISIIEGRREPAVVGTPVEFAQLYHDCCIYDADTRPKIEEVYERLDNMMLTPVIKADDDGLVNDDDDDDDNDDDDSSDNSNSDSDDENEVQNSENGLSDANNPLNSGEFENIPPIVPRGQTPETLKIQSHQGITSDLSADQTPLTKDEENLTYRNSVSTTSISTSKREQAVEAAPIEPIKKKSKLKLKKFLPSFSSLKKAVKSLFCVKLPSKKQ